MLYTVTFYDVMKKELKRLYKKKLVFTKHATQMMRKRFGMNPSDALQDIYNHDIRIREQDGGSYIIYSNHRKYIISHDNKVITIF